MSLRLPGARSAPCLLSMVLVGLFVPSTAAADPGVQTMAATAAEGFRLTPPLSGQSGPPPVGGEVVADHAQQFGISLMPGTGFRIIVPYEDPSDPNNPISCGDATKSDRRVCTDRIPVFLDLRGSFGVTARFDIIVDLRFGLEKDFTKSRQFALMPGILVWMDQGVNTKLFAAFQFVWDNTRHGRANAERNDFGIRPALGLMYDVIRNVGFYGQLGSTIGFSRWFRMEIDVGAGVQLRFP